MDSGLYERQDLETPSGDPTEDKCSQTTQKLRNNEQILNSLIRQGLAERVNRRESEANATESGTVIAKQYSTSNQTRPRSRSSESLGVSEEAAEFENSDSDSDFEFEHFVGLEQWEQIMNENEVDFNILDTQLRKHEILGNVIGLYKNDDEFYNSRRNTDVSKQQFPDSNMNNNNNNNNNGATSSNSQSKKKKKKKKKKNTTESINEPENASNNTACYQNTSVSRDDPEGDELMRIFKIACVLCDKLTKPCNNDTFNISLDFTSDLLILFSFDFDSIINEFDLSMKFMKIIDRLIRFLKFDDLKLQNMKEVQLRSDEFYDQAKSLFVNTCRKYQGGNNLIKNSGKLTVNEIIENVYSQVSAGNSEVKNNKNNKKKKKKSLDAESILKDYTDVLLRNMIIYDSSFYEGWIPLNLSYLNLELIYSLLVVLIYSVYKLYSKYPKLYYNPFLKKFFELWRTFSNIMMVGIQIDRLDEAIYGPGTPWLVKSILKGCSAIRTVLATILNQETAKRQHDLTHESLNNYMLPFGRKNGDGAFTYDVQIYAAALIVLGNNLTTIGNLFINMEVGDKLDDDIWYIFEYEFTTSSGKKIDEDDDEDEHKLTEFGVEKPIKKDIYVDKEYTARCYCEYDDANDSSEEEIEEEEEEVERRIIEESMIDIVNDDDYMDAKREVDEDINGFNTDGKSKIKFLQQLNKPKHKHDETATSRPGKFGSKDKFEFDEEGNDWRDIPRGENKYFNTKDEELERFVVENPADFEKCYKRVIEMNREDIEVYDSIYYSKIDESDELRIVKFEKLYELFEKMANEKISSLEAQRVLECIILVISHEYGNEIENEESLKQEGNKADVATTSRYVKWHDISSDRIYGALSSEYLFEKMLKHNQKTCFFMIDEMLMIKGYRRVLIWMLSNLSMMNEVRSGKRREAVYLHGLIDYIHELLVGRRKAESRMGNQLILSDIEKKMLFNEFINKLEQLGRTSGIEDENFSETGDHGDDLRLETSKELFLSEKTLEMVCLMIRSLLNKNIVLGHQDTRLQMQSFLIKYIGKVTNVRILYFEIYKDNQEDHSNSFLSDHVDVVMDTILKISLNNELEKVNKYGNGSFQKCIGYEV